MKRKKIDSFTLFVILLLALILTLLGMLLAGMKEEKRQFTVLLPLGDLAYDEDFLQKAKKIKGIKEIWPVIEVPVVIKIEDYTETTTFSGIDMNAFGKNPTQNVLEAMEERQVTIDGETLPHHSPSAQWHEAYWNHRQQFPPDVLPTVSSDPPQKTHNHAS